MHESRRRLIGCWTILIYLSGVALAGFRFRVFVRPRLRYDRYMGENVDLFRSGHWHNEHNCLAYEG